MTQPTYNVKLINNVVIVKISGDWDIQADIGYLSLLDETISKARAEKWALFADLRGWRVSEEVLNFKHNNTIQLTRGRQQVEVWLVDSLEQGSHIQHHVENAGVPFHKCLNEQEAKACLSQYGFGF